MSALIFHTEENQVLVATDTLATLLDGTPYRFTSKVLILPQLRMLMAGTGAAGFLDRWFFAINAEIIVRGIDHLNDHSPRYLAAIWSGYKHEIAIPQRVTTTVYHFGFSEATNSIHSYAYRSDNDFRSERLPYGIAVKPECSIPANYRLPDDIKSFMDEQRRIQAFRPKHEQVFIGGEILIYHLMEAGFNVYRLAEFDDHDQQKQAVYRSLS